MDLFQLRHRNALEVWHFSAVEYPVGRTKATQMPDYRFFGKSRLPRGYSFPLKRSTLDAFLDERDIKVISGVAYCGPSEDQRVLSADYRGWQRSLTLWINAVPAGIRHFVATEIDDKLLFQLAGWCAQFIDPTRLVSQTDHRFEIYYADVHDNGTCQLRTCVDAPRKRSPPHRFRMKIRP